MRMLLVTRRVRTTLQVILTLSALLRLLRCQETLFLLRVYIGNVTLLRLEVVRHRLCLVLIAAFLEHRLAILVAQRIQAIHSMHRRTVHVHVDILRRQVDVLVLHIRIAIQISRLRVHEERHRVLRRIDHRSLQRTLLLRSLDTVLSRSHRIIPLHRTRLLLPNPVLTVKLRLQRIQVQQQRIRLRHRHHRIHFRYRHHRILLRQDDTVYAINSMMADNSVELADQW